MIKRFQIASPFFLLLLLFSNCSQNSLPQTKPGIAGKYSGGFALLHMQFNEDSTYFASSDLGNINLKDSGYYSLNKDTITLRSRLNTKKPVVIDDDPLKFEKMFEGRDTSIANPLDHIKLLKRNDTLYYYGFMLSFYLVKQ